MSICCPKKPINHFSEAPYTSGEYIRLPCGKEVTPVFLKSFMIRYHRNICSICKTEIKSRNNSLLK